MHGAQLSAYDAKDKNGAHVSPESGGNLGRPSVFDVRQGEDIRKKYGIRMNAGHIKGVKEGEFIYDPQLIRRMSNIGKRLGNFDYYVQQQDGEMTVDESQTQALYADLEDYLTLCTMLLDRTGELCRSHKNQEKYYVKGESPNGVYPFIAQLKMDMYFMFGFFLSPLYLFAYIPGLSSAYNMLRCNDKNGVPKLSRPALVEKNYRLQTNGAVAEFVLAIVSSISDLVFISSLKTMLAPADMWLFWVALGSYIAVIVLRFFLGVYMVKGVEIDNIVYFYLGLVIVSIEPAVGFNLLLMTIIHNGHLKQPLIGESAGSRFKDLIAIQAKKSFEEAESSILIAALILMKDVPQLFVQVYFALYHQDELDALFYVTLGTTYLRLSQLIFEALATWDAFPRIISTHRARHLVFDCSTDDENDSVTDAIHQYVLGTDKSFPQLEKKTIQEGEFYQTSGKTKWFPKDISCCSVQHMINRKLKRRFVFGAIRKIELTNCTTIDGDTLALLMNKCNSLQGIDLSFCPKIDNMALATLSKTHCTTLETIKLDSCYKISDKGLVYLAHLCRKRNLLALSLRNIPMISSAGLKHLLEYCPNLQDIYLDRDELWNDAIIKKARKYFERDFMICDIDNTTLEYLTHSCRHSLLNVQLGSLRMITGEGLEKFISTINPYLQKISFSGI